MALKNYVPHFQKLAISLLTLCLLICVSCSEEEKQSVTSPEEIADSIAVSELFSTGQMLERKREYADALTAYTNALEHNPNCTKCLVARGKLYVYLRDGISGMRDLSKAKAQPDRATYLPEIHYKLAEAQLQLGDLKDARKNLDLFYSLPHIDTSRYWNDAEKLKGILKSNH